MPNQVLRLFAGAILGLVVSSGIAIAQPAVGGGGSVTAVQPTGTNLHMTCDSGCSGSTAPTDEAAFTAGTTSQTPVGGFFQTTATSNALTNGQMGALQLTAQRALFINLRNASGAELGIAAAPLQVSLANTAANGTAITVGQATGSNLHVACDSGCSSSSAPADEAAFTFGTTSQTPIGGVFQTTATSNALTTGQMGAFQVTANRALFSNLRNAAGAEVGVAAVPLQVSLANTAANGTAVAVSLAANQSVNEAQINGVTPLMGNGVTGTGAQRVTIASDNTAFTVNAAQSGSWTNTVTQGTGTNLHMVCDSGCSSSTAPADEAAFTAGTTPQSPTGGFFQTTATNNALTTGQMGAFQVTANRALFSNLRNAAGTEVGTSATPLQVSLANTAANGTAVAVSLAANQSVNVAQINGVTPLMGNGVTGTGSQRVTVASDNTAFQVKTLGNTGAAMDFAGQNAASPANAELAGCQFNTTPTTITSGNSSPCQLDSAGNLLVNVKTGGTVAQASTTSGQGGSLIMGAVTTSAPTYTTAQTDPLSLDTSGNLRVAMAANQSVNVAQFNGVTPLMGNGVSGTGAQRVAIASDNTAFSVNPVTTNNVATQPHVCGSHVFKHITTATDTQIVAQSGTNTIYVCDYSISFNGTGNIYLEKATSGTCATLTQIDQAWYGVANAGKAASNPYYQGLNTGASAQLCANTSAGVTIDVAVNYDQY